MKIKKENDGSYTIPVNLSWSELMVILVITKKFQKDNKGTAIKIDDIIRKTQESLVILEDELKIIENQPEVHVESNVDPLEWNFYHEIGDKVIFNKEVLNTYSYDGFQGFPEYKKYFNKVGIVTEINPDLHCMLGTAYTNDVKFENGTVRCLSNFFKKQLDN